MKTASGIIFIFYYLIYLFFRSENEIKRTEKLDKVYDKNLTSVKAV